MRSYLPYAREYSTYPKPVLTVDDKFWVITPSARSVHPEAPVPLAKPKNAVPVTFEDGAYALGIVKRVSPETTFVVDVNPKVSRTTSVVRSYTPVQDPAEKLEFRVPENLIGVKFSLASNAVILSNMS